jgi:DNA-binding response OmpR family regulator
MKASIGATTLVLTRTEHRVLQALTSVSGKAFTREEIIARAWGPDLHISSRTVDVHIAKLRRKIHAASGSTCRIETVWGIGYRLRTERAR